MQQRFPPLPRLAVTALIALVALVAAPAAALAQCPQTSLGEIEREVMCPVCGTPLALATEAPQAVEQREFIVERIERCQSEDEIKSALVAEFGEGVLATPGDDGFDLVAYLLPGLAVLAGAGGIALAAVRWRRGRASAAGSAPKAAAAPPSTAEPQGGASRTSTAESERLAADLDRYDL